MKNLKKALAVMLALTLCLNELAYATSLTEKKNDVQNQINKTQDKIDAVKAEKSSVVKQINALSDNIAEVDKEIKKINAQLDEVNSKLRKTEKELEELEEKKQTHYNNLKLRMRDMYENSTVSYLDIFLESKSFIELIDSVYSVSLIIQKDNEVLGEITKLEEEAKKKKEEIEANKVEVELLKSKQETKRYAIQTSLDEQEKLKSNLSASERSYMDQLEDLEAERQALEDAIAGKVSTTAVYTGGKFVWPVPGHTYISSEYTWRQALYSNGKLVAKAQFHDGLDIPAKKGDPIVAAAAGKVIVAGWVNGYGYTVMIDHGSNIVTLYGHNSALVVTVGQQVSAGQQIAKAGTTGNSTGVHCHFGVRVNGTYVNPHNYVG